MGEVVDRAIDAFKEKANPYRGSWRSVQLKLVGAKQDDSWRLLGLHATSSSEEAFGLDIAYEGADLTMVTDSFEANGLEPFLSPLGAGRVTVAGREFQAIGFGHPECNEYRRRHHGPLNLEFPYVLLSLHGQSVRDLVDESELDRSLRRWGHDRLYEASGEFLGFPVGGANSTCIRVLAPIYIVGTAKFQGSELQVSVTHHMAIDLADIHVSFEVTAEKPTPPRRGKLALLPTEGAGAFWKAGASIQIPEGTRSATVRVFHKERPDPLDICVASRPVIAGLNLPWAALRLLSSRTEKGQTVDGQDVFQERLCLAGQGKDAGRFEVAVFNLMACAGYNSVYSGRESGTTGIDILAFAPDGKEAVAISATLANNIREKLRTLLPQVERLGGDLKGTTVIPSVFAAVEPSVVLKSDKDDAEALEVALVLLPELRQLFDSVSTMSVTEARQSLRSVLLRGRAVAGPGI